MDSEERKKLNRLSRKACGQNFKKRILKNRITQNKVSFKGQKHLTTHNNNQTSTPKSLEFSTDMLKACADINAITPFTGEDMGFLQKHIRQLTSHLVHTSIRIMEQNRRGTPQTSDIDAAAQALGLEASFSAGTGELLPVRSGGRNATPGTGGKMFFIRRDKEVDIKTLLRREPAPVVYDVSLSAHWLAIDGVQPTTPQNPPPDFLRRMAQLSGRQSSSSSASLDRQPVAATDAGAASKGTTGSGVAGTKTEDITLASTHPRVMQAGLIERRSHDVSQELMLYFRELTEACVGANENRRHEALENAAQDTGLQPLLPYLITFITEGVRVNVSNNNLAILIYLMRLTKAFIDNPHISLEAYLHLIVPTVITCILCRQLCAKPITDNHWALRDYAAKQLVTLCNRYNTSSNGLYNRITRELYRVLCTWIEGRSQGSGDTQPPPLPSEMESSASPANPPSTTTGDECSSQPGGTVGKTGGVSLGMAANSLNTLYGVLVALCEFGPNCLRMLVFPMLPNLARRISSMLDTSGTGGLETTLSHADLRSIESLKALMANRLGLLLGEWRARLNQSLTLEAYKADYGVIGNSLFTGVARNQASVAPTPASTPGTTPSTPVSLIVTKTQPPN